MLRNNCGHNCGNCYFNPSKRKNSREGGNISPESTGVSGTPTGCGRNEKNTVFVGTSVVEN